MAGTNCIIIDCNFCMYVHTCVCVCVCACVCYVCMHMCMLV